MSGDPYNLDAYPPLTKAEEYKLAREMRSSRSPKRRAAARDRFIRHNLRLVVWMADRMRRSPLTFEDRMSAGNAGLLIAVDRFDPKRGTRFATYALYWIRHEIDTVGSKEGRLVRTPIRRLADTSQVVFSMDAPLREDYDMTAHETLPDEVPSAESALLERESRRLVGESLRVLTSRERRVIELRFGFDRGEERTLAEVGDVLGISRERVRQIESVALGKLRQAAEIENVA